MYFLSHEYEPNYPVLRSANWLKTYWLGEAVLGTIRQNHTWLINREPYFSQSWQSEVTIIVMLEYCNFL